MYRIALASLLVLALIDMGSGCPRAQYRVTIVDGKEVIEWVCPPGKVMFLHENVRRCFDRCDYCPNGACVENVCHCFPGTQKDASGVCGKICPNCENGWCSSTTKCECNDGFEMVSGKCVRVQRDQLDFSRLDMECYHLCVNSSSQHSVVAHLSTHNASP